MAYRNFKATEILEEIGVELRNVRLKQGYTISSVAEQLSKSGLQISNTLLGRIENGERRIDDDTLFKICAFYHIDPNMIVIDASKEHIKHLSDHDPSSLITDADTVMALYNNLNKKGQQEVSQLMRLMAYMESFKKTEEN